jgi:SAM-dependent methyltransferase
MQATHDFEFDVFFSYASCDRERVLRLAKRLKEKGLRVWLDEWNIDLGTDILLAIEKGLEGSRALIQCLSPEALASKWVEMESHSTLFRDPSNTTRRFIPLMLRPCELPATLRRFKYLDFQNESDEDVNRLLFACGAAGGADPEGAYSYPDPEDKITFATIQALEPMPGYWSYSDSIMRRDFLDRNLKTLKQDHHVRGIDVGCGYGRLLSWFLDEYCHTITALEPDPRRLSVAKSGLDPDKVARVTFAEQTIQDFVPPFPYGLVICSHIIQHVPRDQLYGILSKLRALCADAAKIVIFTTHSVTGSDHYAKAYIGADARLTEEPVSPEKFDSLVENHDNVLPIRFFSLECLEHELHKAGLRMVDYYVYHCCDGDFGELETYCLRDTIVNQVPELKKHFGRDMAVVAVPDR